MGTPNLKELDVPLSQSLTQCTNLTWHPLQIIRFLCLFSYFASIFSENKFSTFFLLTSFTVQTGTHCNIFLHSKINDCSKFKFKLDCSAGRGTFFNQFKIKINNRIIKMKHSINTFHL